MSNPEIRGLVVMRFYVIIDRNRAQSHVVGLSGNTSGPFHVRFGL